VAGGRAAGGGAGAGAGGEGEGGPPARGAAGANPLDQWMPLGEYKVRLDVGGKSLVQSARIVKTIGWSLDGALPHVIR
jgi:hypothetical protein